MTQKILIVDDEPMVVDSTRLVLKTLGYDAVVVADAADAAPVARQERPDLILQDAQMPDLDLDGMMTALRADARTRGIPVVLMSADGEVHHAAAEHDVAGALIKPFGQAELVAVLDAALGRHRGPLADVLGDAEAARRARRDAVNAYFHHYWSTLVALTNYAAFLANRMETGDDERHAAREINRLVIDLEGWTDALRARLVDYVDGKPA